MANIASLPKGLIGAAKIALIGDVEPYRNRAYSAQIAERTRRRDNASGRVYAGVAIETTANQTAVAAFNPLALLTKAKNSVLSIGQYDAMRTR